MAGPISQLCDNGFGQVTRQTEVADNERVRGERALQVLAWVSICAVRPHLSTRGQTIPVMPGTNR